MFVHSPFKFQILNIDFFTLREIKPPPPQENMRKNEPKTIAFGLYYHFFKDKNIAKLNRSKIQQISFKIL